MNRENMSNSKDFWASANKAIIDPIKMLKVLVNEALLYPILIRYLPTMNGTAKLGTIEQAIMK